MTSVEAPKWSEVGFLTLFWTPQSRPQRLKHARLLANRVSKPPPDTVPVR